MEVIDFETRYKVAKIEPALVSYLYADLEALVSEGKDFGTIMRTILEFADSI